jgi:hypothetical protein
VFERLLKLGGLEAMQARNVAKAGKIFDAISSSNGFYTCPVAPGVRSVMNIPFTMATPELEKAFLKVCDTRGLMQLKGHRSVGGIRASVYNAMPDEGVDALVAVMKVRGATALGVTLVCVFVWRGRGSAASASLPLTPLLIAAAALSRTTGVPGVSLKRSPGGRSAHKPGLFWEAGGIRAPVHARAPGG